MFSQTFGPQSDNVKHICMKCLVRQTFGPQSDNVKHICMKCLVRLLVHKVTMLQMCLTLSLCGPKV
jgi:ribosomal protein L40E